MRLVTSLFISLFLLSAALCADTTTNPGYTIDSNKKVTVQVELFLASTCPHCHKEDAFFKELEGKYTWLKVHRNIINEDKNALVRFGLLLKEQNAEDFSVPSAFFCTTRWMGFAQNDTTGKDILKALNYCKKEIEDNGTLTAAARSTLTRWANANFLDTALVDVPASFHSLISLALIDAVNPCSVFCFIAFLGLLFLQETTRERLLMGSLFLVTLGLVHTFQQMFPNVFFTWLEWMRLPAVLVGGLLGFYLLKMYQNKTKRFWIFPLCVLVVVVVQGYQQSCLVNWSYLFEKWVHNQHFFEMEVVLWQLGYQLLYLLPPVFVLFMYTYFINKDALGWFRKRAQGLGLVLLGFIALVMILYPMGFSSLGFSILSFFGVPLVYFLVEYTKKSP
jgi:thiol-disulfide isomerase/thioredoxin